MKLITLTLAALSATLMLSGCKNLTDSTKEKSVNLESTVYGFKFVAADPSTGAMSPTGEMGFGSIRYRSYPVDRGQPFYVHEKISSLWSDASETTIWIGRASQKGTLTYEAVPSTMIKISGDGISSGTTEVKITPSK